MKKTAIATEDDDGDGNYRWRICEKCGHPDKPKIWFSINHAAMEFRVDRGVLTRAMFAFGTAPDRKGRYCVKDFMEAMKLSNVRPNSKAWHQ
jgi:hypothetical protein